MIDLTPVYDYIRLQRSHSTSKDTGGSHTPIEVPRTQTNTSSSGSHEDTAKNYESAALLYVL